MSELWVAWVALTLAFSLMMSQDDGRNPSRFKEEWRERGNWAYVIVLVNGTLFAGVIVLCIRLIDVVLRATMRP